MIDSHMHYGDDAPEVLAFLEAHDLKFLNICIAWSGGIDWRDQAVRYSDLTQRYPDRFAWCTSFDLPEPTDRADEYVDRVCAQLAQDFADGAIACKIWKNIGMEQRKADGSFVLPDDPIFDPILDLVAKEERTLLCHIAEPLECWKPLNPDGVHYGYYSRNPVWHMYNKPEFPSHTALMSARDHLIEKHPDLRVVGAHFGSHEYSMAEVAERLDRYPNYAVDISARLGDIARQDTEVVREFFIKYADRVLFGTDIVLAKPFSEMSPQTRQSELNQLLENYQSHWQFFERSDVISIRNRPTQGLGLPEATVHKFYGDSARQWYPGL